MTSVHVLPESCDVKVTSFDAVTSSLGVIAERRRASPRVITIFCPSPDIAIPVKGRFVGVGWLRQVKPRSVEISIVPVLVPCSMFLVAANSEITLPSAETTGVDQTVLVTLGM